MLPNTFRCCINVGFFVLGVTENLNIMFLFQSESSFKARKRPSVDGNLVVLILSRSNGLKNLMGFPTLSVSF